MLFEYFVRLVFVYSNTLSDQKCSYTMHKDTLCLLLVDICLDVVYNNKLSSSIQGLTLALLFGGYFVILPFNERVIQ